MRHSGQAGGTPAHADLRCDFADSLIAKRQRQRRRLGPDDRHGTPLLPRLPRVICEWLQREGERIHRRGCRITCSAS